MNFHIRSSIGISSGVSGRAFTSIAPQALFFTWVSLIGTAFTGISFGVDDVVCISSRLPEEEKNEVPDLEQNF